MGQQGRSMTRRSRLWLALLALAGLAAAAAPAAGASEGLCLVTNDGGAPATTSVVGVATDGTLSLVDTGTLPGSNSESGEQTAARCGRFVYYGLNVTGASGIAGFEVGPDGSLAALPGQGGLFTVLGLACDEAQGLLFAFEDLGFSGTQVYSYQVGASGALTVKLPPVSGALLIPEDQVIQGL